MGERLQMAGSTSTQEKEKPIIGRRVKTDPTGWIPEEGQGVPDGARCRWTETGPEGTFGIVVSVLPTES